MCFFAVRISRALFPRSFFSAFFRGIFFCASLRRGLSVRCSVVGVFVRSLVGVFFSVCTSAQAFSVRSIPWALSELSFVGIFQCAFCKTFFRAFFCRDSSLLFCCRGFFRAVFRGHLFCAPGHRRLLSPLLRMGFSRALLRMGSLRALFCRSFLLALFQRGFISELFRRGFSVRFFAGAFSVQSLAIPFALRSFAGTTLP